MFCHATFALGPDIVDAVGKKSSAVRHNFNRLQHQRELGRPLKWEDKLRRFQELRFKLVSAHKHWLEVRELFEADVKSVPVVSLAVVARGKEVRFVILSTFALRTVAFSMPGLSDGAAGWYRGGQILPPEVRQWLASSHVHVVVSGGYPQVEGLSLNNVVDNEKVFAVYLAKGVISPTLAPAKGDVTWQSTYALGYHHRPSTEGEFVALVGPHRFDHWPKHRFPGWLPKSVHELDAHEAFYLFYEGAGLLLFPYRLLMHGIAYPEVSAVRPELPFAQMLALFLNGGTKPTPKPFPLTPSDHPTQKRAASPANDLYSPRGKKRGTIAGTTHETEDTLILQDENLTHEVDAMAGEVSRTDGGGAASGGEEQRPQAAHDSEQAVGDEQVAQSSEQTASNEQAAQSSEQAIRNEQVARAPEQAAEEAAAVAPTAAADEQGDGSSSSVAPPTINHGDNNNNSETARVAGGSSDARDGTGLAAAGIWEVRGPAATRSSYYTTQYMRDHCPAVVAPPRPPSAPAVGSALARALQALSGSAAATNDGARSPSVMEVKRERVSPVPPRVVDLTSTPGGCFQPDDVRARLRGDAAPFHQEAQQPPSFVTRQPPDINQDLAYRARRRGDRERARIVAGAGEDEEELAFNRSLLGNAHLSPAERAENPFVSNPRLHHRCDFCTGSHCSRYMKGSLTVNCPRLLEHANVAPTRRLCDYRRCRQPMDHHTAACPTLHARCPRCLCRGHSALDGCDLRNGPVMEALRSDFEECASVGWLTRRRADNIAWGFYPYPATAPRHERIVDYGRLSRLPVQQALGLLQTLLLQYPALEHGH